MLLLSGLGACVPTTTPPPVATPLDPAPIAVDPAAIAPGSTVAATVTNTPGLGILALEMRAAGMLDMLAGAGPFTVFAASDEAFGRLAPGVYGDLMRPENRAILLRLLRYQVVAERLTTDQLVARVHAGHGRAILRTLAGQPITVTLSGSVVTLTSATGNRGYVETGDIARSNGIIHIVNGVLVPSVE